MQKQQTQEHDAGETARKRLAAISKVLCLHRTTNKGYHESPVMEREYQVSAQAAENIQLKWVVEINCLICSSEKNRVRSSVMSWTFSGC
jgi:hypothetical protein